MATIKQWKKEIQKNLDGQELEDILRAFRVLKSWPMFRNEFATQGLGVLEDLVKNEKVERFCKLSNILTKA